MSIHHFLAFCLSTPWALMPDRLEAYAAVLARRYTAHSGQRADIGDETPVFDPTPRAASRVGAGRQGAIAVIPVHGTIVQRASQLNLCEGGTSTTAIGNALNAAMADETVSQVLLEFDSPGGSVFGVSELGDQIRSQRATKPIIGHANSLSASAAYWLMSQCTECFVTPGGQVGSIGVWMAHEDWSKALESSGVKTTLISAGKYKTEGHPYGPLGDDAMAFQQSSVDAYYAAFTKAVARGRNVPIDTVRGGMGQGRVLGADAALDEKMVDDVLTFQQVVKRMQSNSPRPAGRSALAAARNAIQILG